MHSWPHRWQHRCIFYTALANPEGQLPEGVTKSARSAAGGCRRGKPLSQVGVFRVPPPGKFLKMDANGAFLAHFFAEFVSIFSPKILCNFCLQSSMMRENVHLSCRGSYKEKDGTFLSSRSRGGLGVSPRKYLKNECKLCILSPFLHSSCRFSPQKLCVFFGL